jgi:hypothetical protein
MSSVIKAIQKVRPGSEAIVYDNDYATVIWHVLDGEAPTQAQINKAIKEVEAEEIAQAQAQSTAKAELLARLGITAEEAKILLS